MVPSQDFARGDGVEQTLFKSSTWGLSAFVYQSL